MASLKRLLVELIAALAADAPPRRPGVEPFLATMLLLGPLFAAPIFVVLLTVVRLATRHHPLAVEPLLPLAVDSMCAGAIIAAQLVRSWRVPIEARVASYDGLASPQRAVRRLRWAGAALVASGCAAALARVVALH